jgi:hypothetical protein
VVRIDTDIEPIVFPFLSIAEYLNKDLHIGIFFEIPKQLEQEKAHRVIGKSGGLISMGDEGSDEGVRPVGRNRSARRRIGTARQRCCHRDGIL